jgi:hypothetical protein
VWEGDGGGDHWRGLEDTETRELGDSTSNWGVTEVGKQGGDWGRGAGKE